VWGANSSPGEPKPMPSTPVVTDWGTAVMSSVAAALALLLGAIPKLLGFLVILLIGWLIASAIAAAVAAILRAVKFNDLAQRAGLTGFVRYMGIHDDAAGFLAAVAKWFVRLIVLVTAFDALGLPAVSQVLQQLLLWLPNLVVALVVLVIGGLAANALASLVRGATAESGLGNPGLLAAIARVAVWAFAVVVAVNQIGVAATLVNTLFMAVVGGAGAGPRLGLRPRRSRDRGPDRRRLVRAWPAGRAEDGPGSRSRSAAGARVGSPTAPIQEQRRGAGSHADRRAAKPLLSLPRTTATRLRRPAARGALSGPGEFTGYPSPVDCPPTPAGQERTLPNEFPRTAPPRTARGA
jgi:hypothetical protein